MIDGLGERMKEALRAKGASAADCAKATGIAKTTLGSYLNGANDPNATKLAKFADYAGVSANWLLGLPEKCVPENSSRQKKQPAQTKTRVVERTIIVAPDMDEKKKVDFVAEYIGFTKEAIRALHNARAIKIKWIESEEKQ